jgi:hypothetical protein
MFTCGSNNNQQCWCSQYPTIMPICEGQDCRCPNCLKTIIKKKLGDFVQNNPVKMAIPSQYKNKELIQDIDYYIENGNLFLQSGITVSAVLVVVMVVGIVLMAMRM